MPDYKKVYQSQAKEYEALVSREDYQRRILPAIDRICALEGKEIVEFGAGTGRLTRLLAAKAKTIRAFDGYPAMLDEGRAQLKALGATHVSFALADNKAIPLENSSADLTIAGWTFGHCVSWFPETWKNEVGAALSEMKRITRSSGAAIILETLGTGHRQPVEPNESLANYYALLENEFGFTRIWIRTDYLFSSKTEGDRLTLAFFGRTYSLEVREDGTAILPECTGIWHQGPKE